MNEDTFVVFFVLGALISLISYFVVTYVNSEEWLYLLMAVLFSFFFIVLCFVLWKKGLTFTTYFLKYGFGFGKSPRLPYRRFKHIIDTACNCRYCH